MTEASYGTWEDQYRQAAGDARKLAQNFLDIANIVMDEVARKSDRRVRYAKAMLTKYRKPDQ